MKNKGLLDSNVIIEVSKGIISREDIIQNYDKIGFKAFSRLPNIGI